MALMRRTGWSVVGLPAPRTTSMSMQVPTSMPSSAIGAIASIHGLQPTGGYVIRPPHVVVLPQ
jgi:hypothetical protein